MGSLRWDCLWGSMRRRDEQQGCARRFPGVCDGNAADLVLVAMHGVSTLSTAMGQEGSEERVSGRRGAWRGVLGGGWLGGVDEGRVSRYS